LLGLPRGAQLEHDGLCPMHESSMPQIKF
jgi:hypothetical protein